MIVQLLDSVTAGIVEGAYMEVNPRWMLDSLAVVIAPYQSTKEYDWQILETFGSFGCNGLGYEELRFSQQNLLLQSVWFRVPEVHLSSVKVPTLWHKEQSKSGLLRLSSAGEFNLNPTDVRWVDTDGENLVCMTESSLSAVGDKFRLRIARDFELLFIERKFCGWSLSNPEYYLVNSWEKPHPPEQDESFKNLLYESLALISEKNIEKMEDEDTDILQKLIDLHSRIRCDSGAVHQRRILRNWIAEIVERFYEQVIV